jgi:succinyl-CoA synthetase beta subunit
MDGSQVEEGKQLLLESGLNVQCVDFLGTGAEAIVTMVAEAAE